MIGSIQTRNPHVIRVVLEEQKQHGTGRSAAEAIETLALEAVERRRIDRATMVKPKSLIGASNRLASA